MNLEKIKFKYICPSEYNPRKINQNQLNILSKNLNEFGLVDPIIINLKNNHIIGGHQRYKVLQKKYEKDGTLDDIELNILKLGDIGWVFETENLQIKDEAHEKALNLALNKISGAWDYAKLSTLLTDLTFADIDTNLTGFDKFEIDKYTIPSDLGLQFQEIEEINEGVRQPNEDEPVQQQPTNNPHNTNDDNDDENDILVSSEEIEKMFKHECPNCGYKW